MNIYEMGSPALQGQKEQRERSGQWRTGSRSERPAERELRILREECDRVGISTGRVCIRYGTQTIQQLTTDQYHRAMENLKKMPSRNYVGQWMKTSDLPGTEQRPFR